MSLFSRMFSSSSPDVLLVDGEKQTSSVHISKASFFLFEKWMGFLLLFMMLFVFFSVGSILDETQVVARKYYQSLQDKIVEQKNLKSLQALTTRQGDIVLDQKFFSMALPGKADHGSVLIWIEYIFDLLRKDAFVSSPELISWRPLSRQEISSDSFDDLGVTEFSFRYEGEYPGLLKLFSLFRKTRRIMDIRSLRNLSYRDDGLVSVDITFWVYHILSL